MKDNKTGNILAVMLSIVITLLVLEVAVRVYDMYSGKAFFNNVRNKVTNVASVIPFRTFGFQLYKTDSDGAVISSRHKELYSLKKAPGTLRIVAFGGSTTENIKAMRKYKKHYPLLVQSKLRAKMDRHVEVINVGNSAYATPHSIILLALDVLSWDPDIVILSHNHNDLIAAYFPGFSLDYSNKYSHPYYLWPAGNSRGSLISMLFQYSQVYWIAKDRLDKLDMKYNDKYNMRTASYGDEPPANMSQVFARNLHTFVSMAKEKNIQVVLGTQPLHEKPGYFLHHMSFKPYNDVVKYPVHKEYISHHKFYNKVIRNVAKETDSLLVDNQRIFANRRELFYDHIHYTEAGVEQLSDNYTHAIFNSLTRNGAK